MTDKEIRNHFGHNGSECKVRIARDGDRIVSRYGSPNPTDRGHDFWSFLGYRAEIVSIITRQINV